MRFPRPNFDPASQAWARKVEDSLNNLERGSGDTNSKQGNSARGMAATLSRLSEQVNTLQEVVAQQPVILRPAFINSASFALNNTSFVTRGTAAIMPPGDAQFAIFLGDVSLNGSSSGAPPTTQIIDHQMVLSVPMSGGGTSELILNTFPSLIMPSNAGAPVIVTSGGPISGVENLVNFPGGNLTFSYQTRARFGSYVGSADVTANIFALFFFRPLS